MAFLHTEGRTSLQSLMTWESFRGFSFSLMFLVFLVIFLCFLDLINELFRAHLVQIHLNRPFARVKCLPLLSVMRNPVLYPRSTEVC